MLHDSTPQAGTSRHKTRTTKGSGRQRDATFSLSSPLLPVACSMYSNLQPPLWVIPTNRCQSLPLQLSSVCCHQDKKYHLPKSTHDQSVSLATFAQCTVDTRVGKIDTVRNADTQAKTFTHGETLQRLSSAQIVRGGGEVLQAQLFLHAINQWLTVTRVKSGRLLRLPRPGQQARLVALLIRYFPPVTLASPSPGNRRDRSFGFRVPIKHYCYSDFGL